MWRLCFHPAAASAWVRSCGLQVLLWVPAPQFLCVRLTVSAFLFLPVALCFHFLYCLIHEFTISIPVRWLCMLLW
uniref:Uncharacterized protein n=1 Tax=Arundo donax TaxID=35708 RepID=A0A0A9DUN9_ARUDO